MHPGALSPSSLDRPCAGGQRGKRGEAGGQGGRAGGGGRFRRPPTRWEARWQGSVYHSTLPHGPSTTRWPGFPSRPRWVRFKVIEVPASRRHAATPQHAPGCPWCVCVCVAAAVTAHRRSSRLGQCLRLPVELPKLCPHSVKSREWQGNGGDFSRAPGDAANSNCLRPDSPRALWCRRCLRRGRLFKGFSLIATRWLHKA